MTPEEKFRKNVWWVLQAIKYEELLHQNGESIYFSAEKSDDSPSVNDQDQIIHILVGYQVIEILNLINNYGDGYGLRIIQPKFNELYNLYNKNLGDKPKTKEQEEKNNHVERLHIVRSENKNNTFLIIVNDDYQNPVKEDRAKPSWNLLFMVAEGEQFLNTEEYKSNLEYLNTNKACKLYTQTGYSVTKILGSESEFVVPTIPIEIISEKAFKQRQKKGRKET